MGTNLVLVKHQVADGSLLEILGPVIVPGQTRLLV